MGLRSLLALAVFLVVLGVVYYYSSQTDPPPPSEPRPFVWDVEMEELAKMSISIPPRERSESWVKHDDRYWYFDEPDGPKVNMERWGGGIPLLLSGPGAERRIASDATDEQLEVYGMTPPHMQIDLTLENQKTIEIDVGDPTPDRQGYYVRLRASRDIYTVHESWYHVLERLVLDPPYPDPDEEIKPLDPKEQEKLKKVADLARANRERGDAYREKNRQKPGVVELESGIQYRILKEGSGSTPGPQDNAQVHYTGRLINGTQFDGSGEGKPITFNLRGIIRGWREVLQLMPVGSRWEVVIPPELAYGKRGSGGNIGANETLIFEIELFDFN